LYPTNERRDLYSFLHLQYWSGIKPPPWQAVAVSNYSHDCKQRYQTKGEWSHPMKEYTWKAQRRLRAHHLLIMPTMPASQPVCQSKKDLILISRLAQSLDL
jgi:hypothetical protein